MANRRDGGRVVIGVDDDGTTVTPRGLTTDDLKTWSQDAVAGALAAYSDPYVEIHVEAVEYKGITLVLIAVEEFREAPVLCKKDYPDKLRAGACYVRRRGRTETSEIPTQAEMRELLELATEKRLRSFLRQAREAGLAFDARSSAASLFDAELGEFENPIVDKIKSRGYWYIRVRPSEYLPNRIANISELQPILGQISVRIRGWDFPHVDRNTDPQIYQSCVAEEVDWESYIESWRFYQSGQFAYLGAFWSDWPSQFFGHSRDTTTEPGGRILLIEDAVAKLAEVAELASRLSASPAGSDRIWIQISVCGLEGRQLSSTSSLTAFFLQSRTATASLQQLILEKEFSREQLLAESDQIALEWVRELFRRFNWDPGPGELEGIRSQFRRTQRVS